MNSERWLNAPNTVSLIRLALVPVYLWLHFNDRPFAALLCFCIASLSDGIDGLLARVLNQRTRLGAVLDAVADKILILAALLSLMVDGVVPIWLLAAILFRDGSMIVGAVVVRRKNLEIPTSPSRIGKYATFTLVCLVVLALTERAGISPISLAGYTVVIGFISGFCVVVSTLQYFARFGYLFFAPARRPASSNRERQTPTF